MHLNMKRTMSKFGLKPRSREIKWAAKQVNVMLQSMRLCEGNTLRSSSVLYLFISKVRGTNVFDFM